MGTLTHDEATALEDLLRFTAGMGRPDGTELHRDDLHQALGVLVAVASKKPSFAFAVGDVGMLTAGIHAQVRPSPAARPEPEWDENGDDVVAVAPVGELPEFEGVIPVAVITSLTGTSQRIHRPIRYREKGVIVLEFECANVGHGGTEGGLKRKHTLKVLDAFELPGRAGRRLLNHLKERYRQAESVDPLPFKHAGDEALVADVVGRTDGSGVALTPAELAELGIDDAGNDSVLVIFDDESRAAWPDDFPDRVGPRPGAGDYVHAPGHKAGADPVLVRQVLDFTDGHVLEEWTDADEQQRLLEEETEAAQAEARADRESTEQLEAARSHDSDDDLDDDLLNDEDD